MAIDTVSAWVIKANTAPKRIRKKARPLAAFRSNSDVRSPALLILKALDIFLPKAFLSILVHFNRILILSWNRAGS